MRREYLKTLFIIFILDALLIGGVAFYHHDLFQFFRSISIEKPGVIHTKITTYIKNNCVDISSCRVNISDFTDFEWDTVCFVDEGASLDSNPEIVPAKLPDRYSFLNAKMIFILKKQIVVFEETPIGVEHIRSGTVLAHKNACFLRSEGVIFNVKKEDNGAKGYYILYHTSSTSPL